jgi:hypothetical protein
MILNVLRQASQPVLGLPRYAKRFIALTVDISLCILTVWLAFYLRLGEFVSLSYDTPWAFGLLLASGMPAQSTANSNPLSGKIKERFVVPLLASVQDEDRMLEIMDTWQPDTIYHAAAYKHVPLVEHNISEGVKNNVELSRKVGDCLIIRRRTV